MILPSLPERPSGGHKGTFGHVLCLAGSTAYPGAAILATRAALRGGCGVATLGFPASIATIVGAQLLCEIGIALEDDEGAFAAGAAEHALRLADARTAVALGPGITRAAGAEAFAHEVAVSSSRPLVLDADGLNAFEGRASDLRGAPAPRILTPHAGEAARLLGAPIGDVESARERAALDLAEATRAVVVLKGPATMVADPTRVHINRTGNSGLATAGSGDVLTGLLVALLAQGMAAFDAAILGAHLHGLAADLAIEELGEHGMIASDVLDFLPRAFVSHARTLQGGRPLR